ncbi:hypothetical protein ACWD1Z_07225 [Streptomyces sp. NPDC002784]
MVQQRGFRPALFLSAVLLAGCGSDGSGDAAADPAELASRARASGIAPEHVYVTEAPGFTLAPQSVGVLGADGFSAVYVSAAGGGQLRLSVDRGTMTADTCAQEASAPCGREGDAWYRGQEYAVPKQGHVVRVRGDGVPREVLRDAALAVRRPTDAELDTLLPQAPAGGGPVERGDLPPEGDGAPGNQENTTG